MALQQKTLALASGQPIEVIEIADAVRSYAENCGLKNGFVLVASLHTTLGVVINERCENLQKDMVDFLNKIAPPDGDYRHNRVAVDGRPNAHSHLLSLLIPSQISIVLKDGKLQLGTWQSLFALELDGPRPERKIHVTVMGD